MSGPLQAPCVWLPLSDTRQEKPDPGCNQNRPKLAFLFSATLRPPPPTPTIHTQSEDHSYGTGWEYRVPMGRTIGLYSGEPPGQPASLLGEVRRDHHPLALSWTTVRERLASLPTTVLQDSALALF